MVDAVTIGALNRIIRNNALAYKITAGTIENTPIGATTPSTGAFTSVTGTTGTFTGTVTATKFLESTVETATSSAVTLSNGGISGIGTTNAATTFVIAAPVTGVHKYIYQNVLSTQAQIVFTGSSLITLVAPLFPTAASSITKMVWGSSLAAGCGVELQALSATQWLVEGSNSTAITFTT
jgi:hypothetical protein